MSECDQDINYGEMIRHLVQHLEDAQRSLTAHHEALKELTWKWRHVKWKAANDNEAGWIEGLQYCADEIESIINPKD